MPRDWSLAGRAKRQKQTEAVDPARQCPACYAVHAPAPECPECGHVYEAATREIKHVDGELSELTAAHLARWRNRPLREVLREAKDEDLADIAKARGYKPGWVFHMRQARRSAAA